MAYNNRYNPDALPAHVEPEQAAQLLSSSLPQQQQPPPPLQVQAPHPPQQSQAPPPLSPRLSNLQRPHAFSTPQSYGNQAQQYQNKPPPPLPGQNNSQFAPGPRPSPLPGQNSGYPPPGPQNFGYRPPPQQNNARPPPQKRPPAPSAPTAAPNSITDASLFPLFKAVDKNGTGQLTERELGKALVNGDFTSFDQHTVRMMIRMFDADKNGSVGFEEFCGLWSFLASWRSLFDRFDKDGSGSISFSEYTDALVAFGYRLTPNFVQLLYNTYDKGGEGQMSFDLFVQSCIILKRMTDVFKKYDEDRDGYITMSFEEFLTEIIKQR